MSTVSELGTRRPEAVQLAIGAWALALLGELIHQILQIVMSLIDPAELLAVARESADEGMSETAINLSVYGSIVIMALINVLILIGLTVALRFYATRHRLADGARRLLMVFSLYFALRGLLVFVAGTAGPGVPVWLMLIDGSLQLLVAVAAILGLVFSGREESMKYITPADSELPADKK